MNCKYLKVKTQKYIKHGYCAYYKKEVQPFCRECSNYKMKSSSFNTNHSAFKKSKSKKLLKLERNRYSIIYNDMNKCCKCGSTDHIQKNEIYEGAYRQTSMKLGMVAPFCHKCHKRFHHDREFNLKYKAQFQKEYMKNHSLDEFISIFKQNYIYLYDKHLINTKSIKLSTKK